MNLALCHACKVPEIHNLVCLLKSVGFFFKFSPKRQRTLEGAIEELQQDSNGHCTLNDDTESEAGNDTDDDNDDDDNEDDNEDGHSSDTSDESSPIHDKGVKTDSGNSQTSKTKIKPLCETRWVERYTTLRTRLRGLV